MRKSPSISFALALLAVTILAGCNGAPTQRVAAVTTIEKADVPHYQALLAHARPELADILEDRHITKYCLYLGAKEKDPQTYYIFRYFEYNGDDLHRDLLEMDAQQQQYTWRREMDALQKPLPSLPDTGDWTLWPQVFFTEGATRQAKKPQRVGSVIGLKSEPEKLIAYTQLHAACWPGVLAAIEKANIHNYSIFMGSDTPGQHMLFSYFEYVGDNFAQDMKDIGDDKITQVWWTYTDPLQNPLPSRAEGEHWTTIKPLIHIEDD